MIEKALELVKVVAVMDALNNEQGRYRLGEIKQFAKVSRATCDRHLRLLVSWELLKQEEAIFKGRPCRCFSITQDGRDLMNFVKG